MQDNLWLGDISCKENYLQKLLDSGSELKKKNEGNEWSSGQHEFVLEK